jgi:methyltransferase FkbM-like protein
VTARPRKVPYYARSLGALLRLVRPGSWLAAARRRPIELRNGLRLQTTRALDYLILKEVVCDDVYRVRDLPPTARLVVDIGAGIGEFALVVALRHPEASVLAFEPDETSFRALEANIAANGAVNVEAHRLAIGVHPPAGRLQPFLRGRKVDLLKVDCEGDELDVLESAGPELDRVRRIVLEYQRHLLPEADGRAARYLRDRRFLVHLRADPYDERIGYADAEAPA